MSGDRPIRTPIRVRIRRFRERAAPVAVFVVAAGLAGVLWQHQSARPQLVGEVQAVRYELRSATDGRMVDIPGTRLDRFTSVRRGQIIAQLDDATLLAEHATMLAELARLRSSLTAAELEAMTQAAEFDLDSLSLARRLAVDVEQHRLESVSLTARIQSDDTRLQRADVVYNAAQQAFDLGAQNQVTLEELRLRRDEIAQRLDGQRAELTETRTQLASASDRLESLQAPGETAQLDVLLAPLRAELTVHESRLRELEIEAQALTLRSPIEGTISIVHSRPGQPVREGDPLLTVTSPLAASIVAYLREPATSPLPGARVEIRPMSSQSSFLASIDAVDSSVELIPEHLRRDSGLPEWGRAVRIAIPEGAALTPGELVSIRLVKGM